MVMSRFLAGLLAVALVMAIACNHASDKAEQLAALDNAYQSGLLTKDEYDAKRRALTENDSAPAAAAVTPSTAPEPSPSPVATPVVPARRASAAPVAASTTPSRSSSNTHAGPAEPAPLAGCQDTEYKSGGQKGAETRFFAASPEVVRRAAVSALDSLDFNIRTNTNKEIEASKKRHLGAIVGAGGERVILTFKEAEQGGQSGTRVVGQTKKNFVGHVSQKTWTDAVLAQIACKLSASSQ
jgi:hypothetical protein